MADKAMSWMTRAVIVLVVLGLIAATTVFYLKAEREARRNSLAAGVVVAWLQDMADEKKDLPRFVPAAKASIAAEREALANDPAALSGRLAEYLVMSAVTHISFMGGRPAVAPAVVEFETALGKQFGDLVLRLVDQKDERSLAYLSLLADSNGDELIPEDVLDRALIAAVRFARTKTPVPATFLSRAASRLNGRSWNVARETAKSAAEYAHALEIAETAVSAAPDDAEYVNTLAYAQYRVGRYQEAAATIARATSMRKEPSSLDGVMVAMTAARTGKPDAARLALTAIDERLAANAKDAISKKRKPYVDSELQRLLAEARALVPVVR
jgi:tetratricopeptide (TPR) repeat protein